MTSLQLQDEFPKINLVSVAVSIALMYLAIVRLRLQIWGFILGFTFRFLVEMIWEGAILCSKYPKEARFVPSVRELKSGFGAMAWFSFVYILGYSAELVLFEMIPFILFRSEHPTRNIALWMSLYQFPCLSRSFSRGRRAPVLPSIRGIIKDYFLGGAAGISLRSSILFHMGRRNKEKVYMLMRLHLRYIIVTMVVLSALLCLSRHLVAGLFFRDPHMKGLFGDMLFYYSLFMISDTVLPIFGTLMRTFGMNSESSLIIFLGMGVPLLVFTYLLVVYFGLEHLSPIFGYFLACLVSWVLFIFFLLKNTKSNLNELIWKLPTENEKSIELIVKDT